MKRGLSMPSRAVLGLSLALVSTAFAAPDSDQPTPQRALCGLLKGCGLTYQSPACTEALSEPVPSVSYDSLWCGWVRGFERRGIVPDHKTTYEMYRYMGTKYHVTYVVRDTLDVPFLALDHLVRNVPVTAKLINRYRGTSYSAEFPNTGDSSFFRGSNGSNLTGSATEVWKRDDHRERVYYGVGRVKILSWALKGNVIIEMKSWPSPVAAGKSVYVLRFTMFPMNGFINSIMNLGLFRSVALGKIEDILQDIRLASAAYARGDKVVKDEVLSPAEQASLQRFETLYREGAAR